MPASARVRPAGAGRYVLCAGLLLATRAPALVAQGDCVACIAHDVDPASLR